LSKEDDLSPEHISWLVESRSKNQAASLKLYLVAKDHAEKIAGDWDLSNIAQSLSGVSFSLWRAVFLSDIKADMAATGADAQSFLGNLILHNMIAYPQDRNTREWTFIYYVNNAMYRLGAISKRRIPTSSPDRLSRALMRKRAPKIFGLTIKLRWKWP
jgi:hypothetical protein